MAGHHVLSELRRRLIMPGAERSLLALLMVSVLLIAGSLALLQSGSGSGTDRSEIAEIHG
ncbi:hypothetical protein [Jiangella mangrovi]|uniref:Uncharacterized protein n=1 Tax=Jiangella mangrovi TaxID=1524084 RepID=A0A7W9GRY3_9ACTN|nr:hypothetical protein [Jiangella mangrovi]MBB5788940.1 hypothetical protein [Jiangella mangrovi]